MKAAAVPTCFSVYSHNRRSSPPWREYSIMQISSSNCTCAGEEVGQVRSGQGHWVRRPPPVAVSVKAETVEGTDGGQVSVRRPIFHSLTLTPPPPLSSVSQFVLHSLPRSHPLSQSINQSINQPITQSINQPTNQSIDRSLTHSLIHSPTHSLTHSINQSIDRSITRSLTHSLAHSFTHSLARSLTHSLTHSIT